MFLVLNFGSLKNKTTLIILPFHAVWEHHNLTLTILHSDYITVKDQPNLYNYTSQINSQCP